MGCGARSASLACLDEALYAACGIECGVFCPGFFPCGATRSRGPIGEEFYGVVIGQADGFDKQIHARCALYPLRVSLGIRVFQPRGPPRDAASGSAVGFSIRGYVLVVQLRLSQDRRLNCPQPLCLLFGDVHLPNPRVLEFGKPLRVACRARRVQVRVEEPRAFVGHLS